MTRCSPAWPLAALALAAFAIGTSEFAPMALLPQIAEGLGVSIAQGGLLATVYAAGVVVGAPTMTLLLARLRRRDALLILIALFTLGNALSALAPTWLTLAGARIVTSLWQGAFFGIGALVAAELAGKGKASQAVATMFLDLTVANLVGAPVSATIGDLVGWRTAFGAMAGLGLLALVAMAVALDRGEPGRRPDIRHKLSVLHGRAVLGGLAITALSAGAMFSVYTYCRTDGADHHAGRSHPRDRDAGDDRDRLHGRQPARRATGGAVFAAGMRRAGGRRTIPWNALLIGLPDRLKSSVTPFWQVHDV